MFKNVLVGVDGRPTGRDAIALARQLMDPDATLSLALVHSGKVAEEREECLRVLQEERSAAGVEAQLLDVVSTNPGRGLHEQAEELGADLLVVGSCSRGSFGRVMLGDDTRAALNGAPCAVAVASRGYTEHPAIAKIGVAYNASPESEAALVEARELAQGTGASIHALEVITLPPATYGAIVGPTIGESIELMVKEATTRMQELPGVDGRAEYGVGGEELAAFGDEVDILLVGSRGYGPLRRLILGSTSEFLQRHARCSLLVLARTSTASNLEQRAAGEAQVDTAAGAR